MQTLKTMLKRFAITEDNKFAVDSILPLLLFTYHQATTGFLPFDLLYSMYDDVLKESWESGENGDESMVSYASMIRNHLSEMSNLVQENIYGGRTENTKAAV